MADKFDYLSLFIVITPGKNGEPVVTTVNNKTLPDKPALDSFLSDLGNKHWELSTVTTAGLYIFHRPIAYRDNRPWF